MRLTQSMRCEAAFAEVPTTAGDRQQTCRLGPARAGSNSVSAVRLVEER